MTTKRLTKDVIDTIATAGRYIPHHPQYKILNYYQVVRNNIVFFELMQASNIPCFLRQMPQLTHVDDAPPEVKVLDEYVGYDSWGFCTFKHDQITLEEAYNYIYDYYNAHKDDYAFLEEK